MDIGQPKVAQKALGTYRMAAFNMKHVLSRSGVQLHGSHELDTQLDDQQVTRYRSAVGDLR